MKLKKIAAAVLAVALVAAAVPMRTYALDEKQTLKLPQQF